MALAGDLLREAGLDERGPAIGPIGVRPVAVGWATVELDRVAPTLLGQPWRAGEPDALLGATTAVRAAPGEEPSTRLVLLEPFTEGRLAGSLARRGEGPAVLYLSPVGTSLRTARERLAGAGIRTRSGRGPLGEAALVVGRAAGSPQLVLVAVPSAP
jgi:hypothetical protein